MIFKNKNVSNDVISNFLDDEKFVCGLKPSKVEWILLSSIIFFSVISLLYSDITVTTLHGYNLWDSGIVNFYEYNSNPNNYSCLDFYGGDGEYVTPGYPFPIYLFFAVWNFPTWLIAKFTSFTFTTYVSPLPWIWAKLLMVFFVILCAYEIYEICILLGTDKNSAMWAVFIFLSSFSTVVPAFVIAQYDTISLFFTLAGIRAFIENREHKFIMLFSIAIVLKYFAAIIFIPLILLYEKNILKIFVKILFGLSISLFFLLFYKIFSKSFSNSLVTGMLDGLFAVDIIEYSVFWIFYVTLCLFLWLHSWDDKKIKQLSIYISMIAYLSFFIILKFGNYYWMILSVPFITITILFHKKRNLLLLLSTLAQMSSTVYIIQRIHWFFDFENIERLNILPQIIKNANHIKNLNSILGHMNFLNIVSYLPAVYVVFMIYIAIVTNPITTKKNTPPPYIYTCIVE